MKLFISWSGSTSQSIADEMRKWIGLILPQVKPFITTTDIDKGAQWEGKIRAELQQSDFGIVILTRDNLDSQWVAFEAGALSKHLEGRVATILFGISHADIKPPLSIFQGTIFNVTDFRQLITNINDAVVPVDRRSEDQIDAIFPMLWPKLEDPIKLILENASSSSAAAPAGPDIPMVLQEMMAMLRLQNSLLSSPEKFFTPVVEMLEAVVETLEARERKKFAVQFSAHALRPSPPVVPVANIGPSKEDDAS
jgi:hypothetical protein